MILKISRKESIPAHVISLTYAIAGAPYKSKQTQNVRPIIPLSRRRERVGVRVA